MLLGMLKSIFQKSNKSEEHRDSSNLHIIDKNYKFDRLLDATKCPYCEYIFETTPSRSRNCPSCKLRVIRRSLDKQTVLLTESEAEKLDDFLEKQRNLKAILIALRNFYPLPNQIFKEHEQKLTKISGNLANPDDIFWSICNFRLQEESKINDFDALASIYWEMGKFLHSKGKDCSLFQKEYFVNKARALRKEATKAKREYDIASDGLELFPSVECTGASTIIKKKYDFSEFIKDSPIPSAQCNRGWCNCSISICYRDL